MGDEMNNNEDYHDPNIERLYGDLLKLNLKSMAPDESSETWEVIKMLYKKERRRRWRITLTQVAVTLSAAVAIGAIIYNSKDKRKKNN